MKVENSDKIENGEKKGKLRKILKVGQKKLQKKISRIFGQFLSGTGNQSCQQNRKLDKKAAKNFHEFLDNFCLEIKVVNKIENWTKKPQNFFTIFNWFYYLQKSC